MTMYIPFSQPSRRFRTLVHAGGEYKYSAMCLLSSPGLGPGEVLLDEALLLGPKACLC